MDDDYEVPSPHEQRIEELAGQGSDGLAQRISLMTAVLATIAALLSYASGSAQNEAMFLKNQSILKQAEASDQWAYYQAKSMKEHLDDAVGALAVDADTRRHFLEDRAKQASDKALVQHEAQRLQEESRSLGRQSEAKLRPHEHLAMALTFLQIAIALAAITVLTRRRWLWWSALLSASVGLLIALTTLF
ncbi:DUF4337 domain-containing protein [Massilia sp. PWRC2]|uniref:DUF4337 domain-containing protein n=1 Tax=Massilia sp. PWRC2 TaxID=2804626 RepID=UPI003CEE60A1